MDLDFITWTADIGGETAPPLSIVRDNDARFSYSGPWSSTDAGGRYEGGTAHLAISSSSSATLNFLGDAVSLYGATGLSYGTYSVQLDGGDIQTYDANKKYTETQVLLYHASKLGGGTHSLAIANAPDSNGAGLLIDYAMLLEADVHKDAVQSEGAPSSGRLPAGAVAGIAVGAVIASAIVALALFFIVRRKRRGKEESENGICAPAAARVRSPHDPIQPYMYTPVSSTSDLGPEPGILPASKLRPPQGERRLVVVNASRVSASVSVPPNYDQAMGV